jgi:hypothetical protein
MEIQTWKFANSAARNICATLAQGFSLLIKTRKKCKEKLLKLKGL